MKHISTALGVPHAELEATGALDGFVDFDLKLHVDPHLLRDTTTPELAPSYERIERHFTEIIHLLRQSKYREDLCWRAARKQLMFRELPFLGIGYSRGGTGGNAIGLKLATDLGLPPK